MDDEWGGQRVKCPECRETVPVPGGTEESSVHAIASRQQPSVSLNPPSAEKGSRHTAEATHTTNGEQTDNGYAKSGFIVALVSIPLYFVGVIPLVAIVLSTIGLNTFDENTQKNKWMAGWGLGIGIVFMVMNYAFWRGWLEQG